MQPEKPASVEGQIVNAAEPQPIGFELYNFIVASLVPLEVKIVESHYGLEQRVEGPFVSDAHLTEPRILRSDSHDGEFFFTVEQRAEFSIKSIQRELAAKGSIVFNVRLQLAADPPESFWDMFLPRNIRLYTHPVLREIVASYAARSGLLARPIGSVAVLQNIQKSSDI